jgi:hypothetical protein
MTSHELSFIMPFPKIGSGKHANAYATMNRIGTFYRWGKTKIKNQLQDMLKEWYVPQWEDKPFRHAVITYQILRDSKRKIDPDASAWICKYINDVLVQQGYLVDDDRIRIIYEPPRYGIDGVETSLSVHVKFSLQEKDNDNTGNESST